MPRIPLRILLTMALTALCAFAIACGGDDESEGTQAGTEEGTPAQGQRGGRLTQLSSTDVDYLDPGHTYYQVGFEVAYATMRPLYNFKPGEAEATPDLAEAPPEISDDAKTVTVRIRRGVRFGPPVNREVTSADVKYAIERAFSANVSNGYTSYFDDIQGAPDEPTRGVREISGIETPDEQTIVFNLREATAAPFSAALVMPITMPVPEEYAREFDRENPSTYNEQVVATGPYMVRNNAQGELVGYRPGRQIELVRNPNWDAKTDYKPAYLDEILMRTNASDANVAGRQVLEGQSLILGGQPPAAILARVVRNRNQRDQLTRIPGSGFRHISMDTSQEPFDDINVRKAVIAGFDRTALRLARGGEFVGPIAQHYLQPGMPGHEESGGERGFQEFDFMRNPKGDMNLAAEYFRKAGYESGRFEGNEEILIVASNADPGRAQAQVAQAQFEKLGFQVRLRQVPQDAVYTEWCQRPDRNIDVCGSGGWFKDYNDPQSMLEVTFKGSEIQEGGGNNNLSQLDVPEIDRAMDEATLVAPGPERWKAWAEVNRLIVAQAPAVPFVWDYENRIQSANVVGVQGGYFGGHDFTYTSLESPS